MFKKLLKIIFGELNLDSFEFGGMTFYDLSVVKPAGEAYRLTFFADGHRVSFDFNENSEVYVENVDDIESYISIYSPKGSETRFYREISMDSYVKLDIEDQTLESLVKNGIQFNIEDKNGNLLLSVNTQNENLKFNRIKDYLLIKDYSKSGSGNSIEVHIPDGSEIRIYLC